jgi:hypothetical protein
LSSVFADYSNSLHGLKKQGGNIMKRIVLCMAIVMAFGMVVVGCSQEKKEEVKSTTGMVEGTEAVPAMEEHAQPPAAPASDMGQMGHDAAPEAAAPVDAPVEGMVQSGDAAVEGSAMVQEGAAMVEEGAAMVKEGATAVEGAVGEEAGAQDK